MSEEKKHRLKEYQKTIARLKIINIILNKIVFNYDLKVHALI